MVKHDEQTSGLYGGNKVRKLEYLFRRAQERGAERVATFGAVGSNHALATALHAKQLGLECTCFLAHQRRTPRIRDTLNMHLELGTELIHWGARINNIELYRRTLQHRNAWVIPLGGTCWLGATGFVNAGLEFAAQIEAGSMTVPDRIYMANGTMGSVAGLAVGLGLANIQSEIHAVRVADNQFARREFLDKLVGKTAALLHRLDPAIPSDVRHKTNIVWRDDFYAGGYAVVDASTQGAVDFADTELGLRLETTYTGKALAALLHDLHESKATSRYLFWNTYDGQILPTCSDTHLQTDRLPKAFARYYQQG